MMYVVRPTECSQARLYAFTLFCQPGNLLRIRGFTSLAFSAASSSIIEDEPRGSATSWVSFGHIACQGLACNKRGKEVSLQ